MSKEQVEIPEELNFTLNHTISVGGHSAGPHDNAPTPVPLIRAVKGMEGLNKQQVDAFILNLAKEQGEVEAEAEEEDSKEDLIPHSDLFLKEGIKTLDEVAEFHSDKGVQAIDGIGPKGEEQILAFLEDAGYEFEADNEESQKEEEETAEEPEDEAEEAEDDTGEPEAEDSESKGESSKE